VSYIYSADGFPASYSHVLYVTSFRHCNTNTRPHHLEHHPTRNFQQMNSTRHCICEDELLCSFISWDYRARERVRTTKSEISYCTLILRISHSTYEMIAPVHEKSEGMSWVSLALAMLKTESKDATAINNVASTKCLPGHMRFPNPNAEVRVGSSRKLPSGLRNRSGLKTSGSGY
jgi:hypothetical protein